MREIKLMAWDSDKNTFLPTDDNDVYWNCTDGVVTAHLEDKNGDWRELDLIQYTGCNTTKGEDIYDGDIIDGVYTEGYGPERIKFNCRSVISWDIENGKWIVTDIPSGDKFDLYDYAPLDYRVGNKLKNPELL